MAHPDDAEIACGGTLAILSSQGKEIRYLICTSGDKGTKDLTASPHWIAQTREEEQLRAAQSLGVKKVNFLRHADGELRNSPGLRDEIALIVRNFKPDTVFTHDPWRLYQLHPDHRECGFAVCDAVVTARDHLFLPAFYEVGFSPHSPDQILLCFPEKAELVVNITDFMETKLSALKHHESQIKRVPHWREKIRKIGADMAEGKDFTYGEAFKRITLTEKRL